MDTNTRLSNLRNLLQTTTSEAHASIVTNNASFIGQDSLPTDNNTTTGHEIGLSLFGTSSAYREQMEQEFQEKLNEIEKEVMSIRDEMRVGRDAEGDGALMVSSPEEMQRHVTLLKLCKDAHRSLEEIDKLSIKSGEKTFVMTFSPSSMLLSPSSSTNSRFHFGNASGCGGVSSMVRAADIVRRVDEDLDEALRMLSDNNIDVNQQYDEEVYKMHQMQSEMVNEVKYQIRRKKMELRHRAISTLEGCVAVESNKLCIRGGNGGGVVNKKTVAFEGNVDLATPRESNTHSPLGDAYVVLETFTDAQFPVFGETLDRAIKTIGRQLFSEVFEPAMKELDLKDDSNKKVGYYKFSQETVKNSNVGRKYDAVTIKGQGVQRMWELVKMDFVSSFVTGGSNNIVSVASDINPQHLAAASPLAPLAAFLSCLNFLTQVLEFVHCHVLLQRIDLAKLLGKYLFGTYPILTSLSSGSVMLGGVLVGFAAQGEESGEVRPLMVELVKFMRKCIPQESNVEVWRLVPEVQGVLVKEVAAFESKMVDMGFMLNEEAVPKFSGVSSPSGLSVLVNQDAASPINLTIDNPDLSTEASSPPTDQNKSTTEKARSSLSEIAVSFLQAYSENQRSKILNHGRSILLSTDYHNSVQVGKFVPPSSEPGTLEHLDEDPLNAFVFQQCSISTTAQNTLQLVRATLDDATRPEMAKEFDNLPPMLYRAAREVLDLFRAMIPTLYASEIGSIPRMAAILHNDCVFLAHEASLLGAEYKRKFKSDEENSQSKTHLLSEVCTFVDMVPPFRELANKSMGNMLEVQKSQLFELISPRLSSFKQALSSNESVTEWDDADTALRAALYHLHHLSQSWSQVLSREIYHMAIGNLVDTIFTLLLDPILSAEAITDAASRFVHSLFLDAARGSAEVFLVGNSVTMSPVNNPAETASQREKMATRYCMLYEKLQCIGQFMVMRLDDISRGLEEGAFRCITGKELSHLITAAYDESVKRNNLLKALASK